MRYENLREKLESQSFLCKILFLPYFLKEYEYNEISLALLFELMIARSLINPKGHKFYRIFDRLNID